MPKVSLPSDFKGWVATLVSSVIGFVAGTAALAWMSKRFR